MGAQEIDPQGSPVQTGSDDNPKGGKGHDDSIIAVASYVYEVLGLWR